MAWSHETIGVVVLMAGCSNRMPEGNKLLMTLGDTGVSVAEQTIQSIVSAGYTSILIVTGYDADKLRKPYWEMLMYSGRTILDTKTAWEHPLPQPSTL